MYPHLTVIVADQRVADMHRRAGWVAASPQGSGPHAAPRAPSLARHAPAASLRRSQGRAMTGHATGTREEWRRARIALLELEKEHTRRGDELARMRRELPWVPIEK